MTTIDFLDQLSSMHGGASDYRIAKILGTRQQQVSLWRNGTTLSDNWAVKVADALELPRPFVLACVHAERAAATGKGGDIYAVWRQIADAFRDKVAVIALVSMLVSAGLASETARAEEPGPASDQCILSKIRTRGRERRRLGHRTPLGIVPNHTSIGRECTLPLCGR